MHEAIKRLEILGRVIEKVHNILDFDIFIELDLSDEDFVRHYKDSAELMQLKEKLETVRMKLYECLAITLEKS